MRRKKMVDVVYPVRESNIVSLLAGKYWKDVVAVKDLSAAKEAGMMSAIEERFGNVD